MLGSRYGAIFMYTDPSSYEMQYLHARHSLEGVPNFVCTEVKPLRIYLSTLLRLSIVA